ncbi:MAG: hypothetical protein H6Q73_2308 [Firmicutes bacterium]|nr:hypothetical protein [Bacillota bacterium]
MKDGETLRCSNCFSEISGGSACPHCGFIEKGSRNLLALPSATLLNGQYVIGRVLGQGGFGITYLALDQGLETKVAIKEYLPRDLAGRSPNGKTVSVYSEKEQDLFRYGRDRFILEARTLAKFDHPNVVRVRSVFEENGTACLVMDYYDGMTLSDYIEQLKVNGEKLPFRTAVDIMLQVMDGLKQVHDRTFLHRDIKPQNIYITKDGRPILLDFGAARTAVGERSLSLSVIYTPGFAPYEQYQRKGEQGPWTDVYACAATLYFLLTGVAPIDSIDRVTEDSLVSPGQLNSELPVEFSQVLVQAMAVRPKERFQTIREFQDRLVAAMPAAGNLNSGYCPETMLQTVGSKQGQVVGETVFDNRQPELDVASKAEEMLPAGVELATVKGSAAGQATQAVSKKSIPSSVAGEGALPSGGAMKSPKGAASGRAAAEALAKRLPSTIITNKAWLIIAVCVLVLVAGVLVAKPSTGEVALANGIYKGEIKDGKPDGDGSITYNDKSKFEGHFKDGKRQGKGKLIAADGKTVVYEGEWKDDKRNGKGKSYERYSDSDQTFIKYDGLWENDVKQGQGVAWIYKNGNEVKRYEGNFKNGRINDTDAKVFYANGDQYQGGMVNDHFSGQGTYTYASGEVKKGIWENDKLQPSETASSKNDDTDKRGNSGDAQLDGVAVDARQSFNVTLESWGQVRFVSGINQASHKACFYLTDDQGKVICTFPEFFGNQYGPCVRICAVSFTDMNKDGLKDIIVIAQYLPASGKSAWFAGIYFNKGKEFVTDYNLDSRINSSNNNESLQMVIDYVNKNM